MIESAPKTQPESRKSPASGVILVDRTTNTFEFIIKPKAVEDVPSALTIEDRRELARICIGNMELAEKAKAVYAAGGRARHIAKTCGVSLSYSKKLHMAFGRSQKEGSKFKK